ncbi:hypothetical protein [Pseudomonas putida]
MDIESFEPSDESMDEIEERLKKLRESREQRMAAAKRARFRFHFGPDVSRALSSFPPVEPSKPLHFKPVKCVLPLEGETAHTRTLRHEKLLKDLEELGFRKWEESGKRAEFDRLTRQAIELGRKGLFIRNSSESGSLGDNEELVSKSPLTWDWQQALESLNQRARNLAVNSMHSVPTINLREIVVLGNYGESQADELLDHSALEHFQPLHPHSVGLHWAEPLQYVIDSHGRHAELLKTDDGLQVKYEPCQKDAHQG